LWHTFPDKKLQKIFSIQEIGYCRSLPIKSAERFAVRFAAREALFKALSAMSLEKYVPFLTVCKLATINRNERSVSEMQVDWQKIMQSKKTQNLRTHLSMTHDQTRAVAFVVIEEIK